MSKTALIGAIGAVLLVAAIALNFWLNRDVGPEVAQEEPAQEQPAPESATAATAGDDSATVVVRDDASGASDAPSFDVVRLSPDGDSVFAGRAPPGSTVTILLDGEAIGTVEADERGEWVFLPDRPLSPGSHELALRATLPADPSETAEPIEAPEPAEIATAAPLTEPDEGPAAAPAAAPVPQATPEAAGDEPAIAATSPEPAQQETPAPQTAERPAAPARSIDSDQVVVLVVPETDKDIAGRPSREKSQPLAILTPRDGEGASQVLQKPTAVPGGVEAAGAALALDSVDYDIDGRLALRGRGDPGAEIRIYLDTVFVGAAPIAPNGQWLLRPDNAVAPGVYDLRVDQVQDETVTARLNLPFNRAGPILALQSDQLVVVQPGNSLWRIARRTLGSGLRYTTVYEANRGQIGDPDLIYPGQIISVPKETVN
ncbi:MAG: LysM peptidoglycan-binding domain-containing protein [Alphaproteobacteria bacterium]|nr:LysM peptidoglycan-binding domain-containing protein [Alphaproteobacteria bacterium]